MLYQCWPRDQLLPSSSWCNWWECAENQVSSSLCVSLAHPDTPVSHLLLSVLPSLWPRSQPYWAVSRERWAAVRCPLCVHNKYFYAIISIPFHFLYVWVSRVETGCLFAVLHTEGKKCSGFTALHAGCLTSRTKRRQHSSCYRYANVRVVMVAAQPEISLCYLRSAENVRLPPQNTLTHPNMLTYKWHIKNCTFTRSSSNTILGILLCRKLKKHLLQLLCVVDSVC